MLRSCTQAATHSPPLVPAHRSRGRIHIDDAMVGRQAVEKQSFWTTIFSIQRPLALRLLSPSHHGLAGCWAGHAGGQCCSQPPGAAWGRAVPARFAGMTPPARDSPTPPTPAACSALLHSCRAAAGACRGVCRRRRRGLLHPRRGAARVYAGRGCRRQGERGGCCCACNGSPRSLFSLFARAAPLTCRLSPCRRSS